MGEGGEVEKNISGFRKVILSGFFKMGLMDFYNKLLRDQILLGGKNSRRYQLLAKSLVNFEKFILF